MSIQKINIAGHQPVFRANESVKPEPGKTVNPEPQTEVKEQDHSVRNWSIGLGAAAVLIGLGVAGYKGKLGPKFQKFLGGKAANAAEHGAGNATEHAAAGAGTNAGEEAANAAKKAQEKAAKEAQEKAAKEAQEKAAKEAQEKAAKEAQEKAAKEAQEKAAKEAQEKAAKEAQEKAAKEAEEAAQKAYDEEMKVKLTPEAKNLIKDIYGSFGEEAARFTRLYEQAEREGFSKLKGVADALEDGTHRITFTTPSGVKYEYLSKYGDMLDEIRVLNKDGELLHTAEFYRAKELPPVVDICKKTGEIFDGSLNHANLRFEGEHIAFEMDRKTPRFIEWSNSNPLQEESMIHVYQHPTGKINVHYSRNAAKNAYGNSFWAEP